MTMKRIKFPGKLFKRKVLLLDNSATSYNYFVDKIDFDPVYFLNKEHFGNKSDEARHYGCTLGELFERVDKNDMSVKFISDLENMTFYIEFKKLEEVNFKDYRKGKNCSDEFYQFLYAFNENSIFLIRVYGDF